MAPEAETAPEATAVPEEPPASQPQAAAEQVAPGSWNLPIIAEFRANGGKVGGAFEDATLLLLTTTGARSGTGHTTPLTYLREGDRLLVFASNSGLETNPAWFHNLVANPEVTVEVGTETDTATAAQVHGEERDRLYARQAQRYPRYAEYQAQTSRRIPVVELRRRTG